MHPFVYNYRRKPFPQELELSIPAIQKARIGAYIMRNLLAGRRRFPLVLMLEPLFRCNLRCNGLSLIHI